MSSKSTSQSLYTFTILVYLFLNLYSTLIFLDQISTNLIIFIFNLLKREPSGRPWLLTILNINFQIS